MVVNQLLKYGEFGIVLFDNFQVTERTRNQFVRKHTRVRIPLSPPHRACKVNLQAHFFRLFLTYETVVRAALIPVTIASAELSLEL